jgi:hypothetical protein
MITLLQGVAFIAAAVLLAVAGMLVVRHSVELSTLETHNEVAGFVYAVLGVVYAVVLAFVVIVVWEQHNAADQHAHEEAAAIAAVYQLAGGLPESDGQRIRQALQAYARVVIDEEWESLSRGEPSQRAFDRIDDLWRAYRQIEPRTEQEKAIYAESLTQLTGLNHSRWQRLLDSREGVHLALWASLAVGGVLTVAFSYLFGVRRVHSQIAITGTLAAIIAMMLFLIYAIDYPFRGDVRVEPQPFEEVITVLEREPDPAPRQANPR